MLWKKHSYRGFLFYIMTKSDPFPAAYYIELKNSHKKSRKLLKKALNFRKEYRYVVFSKPFDLYRGCTFFNKNSYTGRYLIGCDFGHNGDYDFELKGHRIVSESELIERAKASIDHFLDKF